MTSLTTLAAAATFGPVDPVWVFLARRRFAAKTPIMRVGFPWISLDSLVRIETYQWVARKKARSVFPPAFVVAKELLERQPTISHAEGTDCSWRKLNAVSDFLQYIAALAVPFWLPPIKNNSPGACLKVDLSACGGDRDREQRSDAPNQAP
jgi:hypothetical protein